MENTLRNMFFYALPNNGSQVGINSTTRRMEEAQRCEKIAEEFAIEFAEWHLNLSKSDDWEKFDYNTTEKLLEIYKKEKGL